MKKAEKWKENAIDIPKNYFKYFFSCGDLYIHPNGPANKILATLNNFIISVAIPLKRALLHMDMIHFQSQNGYVILDGRDVNHLHQIAIKGALIWYIIHQNWAKIGSFMISFSQQCDTAGLQIRTLYVWCAFSKWIQTI